MPGPSSGSVTETWSRPGARFHPWAVARGEVPGVVQPPVADGEEVLIPFVSAYVDSVDLPARRIVVDWGPYY